MQSSAKILIVDDSEVDRAIYRRYLESSDRLGWSIIDCESAEAALEICERNCPDLILLDYLLPDTDGLEFLQELTDRIETLPPTIMLTGQGNEMVAVEAMKLGVRDYLIKGQIAPLKLVTVVVNALTQQKLQVQLDRQHQQQNLLARIVLQIGHSTELSAILDATVNGMRELLDCDRAIVYQLTTERSGTIVSESVLPQWSSALGRRIEENCFERAHLSPIAKYLDGHKTVVSKIETANLTPCYVEMLQQFQVQALLVVPILIHSISPAAKATTVWGLLIAHHCRAVRIWNNDELNLLDRLSIQMAIAIQQAELVLSLNLALAKQQSIEQQLRDRVIEIEQANRAKDNFLSNLSHELRSPLTAIIGWAQLLRAHRLDRNKIERGLDVIYRSAKAQSQLIEDMLDLARIASGKLHLNMAQLDLASVVSTAIDYVQPAADAKSIQIGVNLPPTVIRGDVDRLGQVLWNLLTNAIKFTPTGGRVDVTLATEQNYAQIRISDTGTGIETERLPHVFDRFYQGDSSSSKASQGLGLGLSIVWEIVELHGGTVRAESPGVGRGTTLVVQLPLQSIDRSIASPPLDIAIKTVSALDSQRLAIFHHEN